MTLMVNGEVHRTDGEVTVAELLERLSIRCGAVAVEVNRDVVPRAKQADHRLADGDRIEIVTFVGGG